MDTVGVVFLTIIVGGLAVGIPSAFFYSIGAATAAHSHDLASAISVVAGIVFMCLATLVLVLTMGSPDLLDALVYAIGGAELAAEVAR